jgi:hypothetical protein
MFLREEFDQQDDAIFVIMYVPLSSFRSSIYIYILSEMMIRLNRWNKCSVINALQIRIGDLSCYTSWLVTTLAWPVVIICSNILYWTFDL